MRIILISLTLLMFACGGDGDSGSSSGNSGGTTPPPDEKPGGSYSGTITSTVTGESIPVGGLVLEDGEAMFLSQYGIYTAQLSPDGNSISATFDAYAFLGTTWDGVNSLLTGSLNGTVSERSGISGTYTLGTDAGIVALTYEKNLYEIPTSIATVSGTWGYYIPATGYAISVSIDSAGNIFGQDTDSCTYNAKLSVPYPSYNAFRLSETYINCPFFAQEVGPGTGIAQVDSINSTPDAFVFGLKFAQNGYKASVVDFWYRQ